MNGKHILELSFDDEKLIMNRIIQENSMDIGIKLKNLWVLEMYSGVYLDNSLINSCTTEIENKDNLILDFIDKEELLNNHETLLEYLSFIDEINYSSTLKAFILYSLKNKKIPLLENKYEVNEFLKELQLNLKKVI